MHGLAPLIYMIALWVIDSVKEMVAEGAWIKLVVFLLSLVLVPVGTVIGVRQGVTGMNAAKSTVVRRAPKKQRPQVL